MLLLQKNKEGLQTALGKAVPVDYFNRVALTSIRKSPLLAVCTPQSLISELMTLAQLRLVLDTVLGEAYLVPFFNNKLQKYEATLMLGYRGMTKLVRRNHDVVNVTAEVVYEKDEFRFQKGTNRLLHHVPYIKDSDRGGWLGAYAFIAYKDGAEDFEFVPADYIMRVMASSKGSDKPDSPWQVWPESMWKKTAIKQLMKLADMSPEVRDQLEKEDMDSGSIDIGSTVVASEAEASKLVSKREQQSLPAPEPKERVVVPMEEPQQELMPVEPPPAKPTPAKKKAAPAPRPEPPPPAESPEPEEGTLPFEEVDPFVEPVTGESEQEEQPASEPEPAPEPEPEPAPAPKPQPKPAAPKVAAPPQKKLSPAELAAQFRERLEQHKAKTKPRQEQEEFLPE